MLEVKRILDEIENTSGRIDKESILLRERNNELFKEVLRFLYDDYIITGISDKKLKKKVKASNEEPVNCIMEYLKENNTGSDRDIVVVQTFIRNQAEELQELYRAIVTKNLKIGVTANTFNKTYGKGFIKSFKVMLASKYQDHEDKVKDFIATTKLDGCRCVMIKHKGKVEFFTRQGKTIDGLVEIIAESEFIPNMVYDGELVLRNDNNLNSADLFRETMKVVRKDGIKKNVEFHVFDALPFIEFQDGKSKKGAKERKEDLHHILDTTALNYIKEVPVLYEGNDKDQIQILLEQMESEGKEGIMLNISNSKYECKRTRGLLKVKTFLTADVRVLEVIEGTNKNAGKLGAITIEFEHEGKLFQCNCGSGFNDDERVLYYNEPELLIGKIVEIGYFEISENQQGGVGLRFPSWKGIIRDDKTEISMN